MTEQENALSMMDKVLNAKGYAFVYAYDWVWLFKEGKLMLQGHRIAAEDIMDMLDQTYKRFSIDKGGEEFQILAEDTSSFWKMV